MPETPQTLGSYRVTDTLRVGGASSVYRAVSSASGQTVAIKVLAPEVLANAAAVERFHRDAAAAARLAHPNILKTLGAGQEGDRLYLVTEYFDGLPLEKLLADRRLAIAESIALFRGLCRGLEHAHRQGLVHLHLQPRHVLVSRDLAAVKIADFGPSESEALSGQAQSLATGALSLGAFHYLAPEQTPAPGRPAQGTGDARSDLYTAGLLFHQLLTGRAPGGKFTLPSQLVPELPADCDALVLKCLARDPHERYADATALLADLTRLEETLRLRVLAELKGISGKRPGCLRGAAAVLLWFGLWAGGRAPGGPGGRFEMPAQPPSPASTCAGRRILLDFGSLRPVASTLMTKPIEAGSVS
jgi:serine/threonine protein kinase